MVLALLISLVLTTAAPATPKVAVVAEPPSQAGLILVSHIQAAIADSVCVVERADLKPVAKESTLRDHADPISAADLLVLVRVEATRMRSSGWISFLSDGSDVVILLQVKVIDTRSNRIVHAWARQQQASLTEFRLFDPGPARVTNVQLPTLITIRPGKRLARALEDLANDAARELLAALATTSSEKE